MNKERRKAALILVAAVVAGVRLGLVIPGLVYKVKNKGHRGGEPGRQPEDKKEWFTNTIYRIIEPDSNQVRKIKPITEWASRKIDSLEISSNYQLASVLDSVKQQLKPIITEEQYRRLDEFDNRASGHWRGRERHSKR